MLNAMSTDTRKAWNKRCEELRKKNPNLERGKHHELDDYAPKTAHIRAQHLMVDFNQRDKDATSNDFPNTKWRKRASLDNHMNKLREERKTPQQIAAENKARADE